MVTASALMLATLSGAGEELSFSAARSAGGVDVSRDWRVQIKGTTLTVQHFDDRPARTRRLSPTELDVLRRAVATPAFAGLRENYGCRICMDNPFCSIEVTSGRGTQHVVLFAYHDSPPAPASAEGRAVREFHRVWALIKQMANLKSVPDHCRPGSPH